MTCLTCGFFVKLRCSHVSKVFKAFITNPFQKPDTLSTNWTTIYLLVSPADFLHIVGLTFQGGLQATHHEQYLSEEAWSINDHPQTAPLTDPNAPKFQLKEQQEEQYTNSPAHKPTRTICKSKHMIELNNTINTQLKNQKLGIGNGHHKHQPSLQEKGLNSNNTHFSKPNSYTKPSILTKQYHHVTHFLSLQHNSMNNYGGFPQLIMLKSSYSESWNSLSLVARHCSNNQRAMMFNPDVCPTLTRNVDCPSLWSRGPSYPIHRILTN